MNLSREQKLEIYKQLPEEVRALAMSESTGQMMAGMAKKYSISTEKMPIFVGAVGDIFMGLSEEKNLAGELETKVGIEKAKAEQLKDEINALFFSNIRIALAKTRSQTALLLERFKKESAEVKPETKASDLLKAVASRPSISTPVPTKAPLPTANTPVPPVTAIKTAPTFTPKPTVSAISATPVSSIQTMPKPATPVIPQMPKKEAMPDQIPETHPEHMLERGDILSQIENPTSMKQIPMPTKPTITRPPVAPTTSAASTPTAPKPLSQAPQTPQMAQAPLSNVHTLRQDMEMGKQDGSFANIIAQKLARPSTVSVEQKTVTPPPAKPLTPASLSAAGQAPAKDPYREPIE